MSYSRFMYHVRNAPVYLLWLVGGLCVAAAVISLFVWFVVIAAIALGAGLVWWALGGRLEIKTKGVVVGHLKWFTYTPVTKNDPLS